MEIELLPKDSNLVDYKTYESGIIYRQYMLDGNVYHFTLHPDLFPTDNQLEFTGRYLAVFTSVRGLETFYLSPNDEDEDFEVDDDDDETAAERQIMLDQNEIERDMEQMLTQANIQVPSNEDDLNEPAEAYDQEEIEFVDEPIEGMEWLQFDPHKSLLPLMITAIKEHTSQ